MLGPTATPICVSFDHSEPLCAERFERFFGIPASFDASETAIEFDRELNLSLRSLQRKLAPSGTTFSEVLNQVRNEMACHYLNSTKHQVITIAYLLGFSDPSNFSRAFKRWNGESPYHYRQKHLQQPLMY